MNAGHWVARRRPLPPESAEAQRASGPRFERFAAAMREAPPPTAQVLPDTEVAPDRRQRDPAAAAPTASAAPFAAPPHLRPAASLEEAPTIPFGRADDDAEADRTKATEASAAAATVIPRRPVVDDAGRSRADIPWLGIGSWLLLCGALFASLVGWPGKAALDRLTAILPTEIIPGMSFSREAAPGDPGSRQAAPSSLHGQDWTPMLPEAAHAPDTLPPVELAPPIQSEAPTDTPARSDDGPPLPRFKPSVDRVAAQFSNAFFEIGDRLQRQGDFDAALHMRRQGASLDRQQHSTASDL